jgi:hypothetical protein
MRALGLPMPDLPDGTGYVDEEPIEEMKYADEAIVFGFGRKLIAPHPTSAPETDGEVQRALDAPDERTQP